MSEFNPKQARLTLGLNQSEMARLMGIHRNLWVKWERGEQRITAAPVRLLAVLLFLKAEHPFILDSLCENL